MMPIGIDIEDAVVFVTAIDGTRASNRKWLSPNGSDGGVKVTITSYGNHDF